jgi:pyroglutamyl-peptidase
VRALLTGFEPFGGDAVNESWEAVRTLAARWAGDDDLVTACLPVTFAGATAALRRLVDAHTPDVVVCAGLAAGAAAVRLERVAVNVADARIPDNAGAQPVDEPVVAGGPVGYFSTLPLKAALAALRDAGIPAVVSNTAGTYVCNATFYVLGHVLAGRPGVRAGFVHVPRADAVPADVAVRALGLVVRTALDHARGRVAEPALAAGAEH